MTTLIKAAAAATLVMFGASTLMAQTQTPDTKNQPASEAKKSPNVQDEKPTDPNTPKQPLVKKLEKDNRKGGDGQ